MKRGKSLSDLGEASQDSRTLAAIFSWKHQKIAAVLASRSVTEQCVLVLVLTF